MSAIFFCPNGSAFNTFTTVLYPALVVGRTFVFKLIYRSTSSSTVTPPVLLLIPLCNHIHLQCCFPCNRTSVIKLFIITAIQIPNNLLLNINLYDVKQNKKDIVLFANISADNSMSFILSFVIPYLLLIQHYLSNVLCLFTPYYQVLIHIPMSYQRRVLFISFI